MIDLKKVFIDTAPFIYYIEKDEDNPQYFAKVKNFLENIMIMTQDFIHR